MNSIQWTTNCRTNLWQWFVYNTYFTTAVLIIIFKQYGINESRNFSVLISNDLHVFALRSRSIMSESSLSGSRWCKDDFRKTLCWMHLGKNLHKHLLLSRNEPTTFSNSLSYSRSHTWWNHFEPKNKQALIDVAEISASPWFLIDLVFLSNEQTKYQM